MVYYYKNGKCKYCYFKDNPPKKIKPYSERGKQRTLDYKKARLEFMETRDVCQVNLPGCLVPYPVEDKSALECHHMAGRQGNLISDKSKFLCVCKVCHEFLTRNSRWAIDNGFSLPRIK